MLQKLLYSIFICLICWNINYGQESSDGVKIISNNYLSETEMDPLSPAKATFYSAILPGLGQVYNKKYWKVPIIYAAMGTSMYFYIDNKNELERYQTAYKLRISGREDEFNGEDGKPNISDDGLIRAQEVLKKNRDLSLFITIGLYALNIIEANVDAHLSDKAFDPNLSFRPSLYINPINNKVVTGINLKYNFK